MFWILRIHGQFQGAYKGQRLNIRRMTENYNTRITPLVIKNILMKKVTSVKMTNTAKKGNKKKKKGEV